MRSFVDNELAVQVAIMAKNRGDMERPSSIPQVLDNLLEGCALLGFDLTYLYVNDAGARHRDQKRENLLGRTLLQMYPGADRSDIVQRYLAVIESRVPQHFEGYYTFSAAGGEKWLEFSVSPVPEGIFVLTLDVTKRKRAEQRERLRGQVLDRLTKSVPLVEVLEAIARAIEAERPEMLCTIKVLDPATSLLAVAAAPSLPDFYKKAIDKRPIGAGIGSCGHAAYTKKRVIAEDIRTHPNWAVYKDLAVQAGMGACWSEPVLGASGKVLGTFGVYFRAPRTPDDNEIESIENYANITAIAIERWQSQEEARLSSLVLQNSSEGLLVTDENNCIIAVNPAFSRITGYSFDEVKGKNPKIFSSGRHNRAYYRAMWHALLTTGQWQGEIWDKRKTGEIHAKWLTINTIRNKDGSVHRYVALFSDITEKKQSEELIWKQANYDMLTELPNRRLFLDRLQHEIKKTHRTGKGLALLFIDLDRFKGVNDTLGHAKGDVLLVEAARRISSCVRESDTVARLGGDEFTVMLTEFSGKRARLERTAQDIIHVMSQPFDLSNGDAGYISSSIGIALYPDHAKDLDELMKHADQAMYASKAAGRNRFTYFTPSMEAEAREQLLLTNDLRQALARNELEVYYQPIIDMVSGKLTKAEALLRWNHPGRGIVSPATFIPLAEESGLILEIGDWVFQQAIGSIERWRKQFGRIIQVSVNKSPVQFEQAGRRPWLDKLKGSGLPANSITVEITEGLLIKDSQKVKQRLLEFHNRGVEVSIDDFGTGFSALSYLKHFDIDYLKIDRSFVSQLTENESDKALVEAIIVMAHKLGIETVAEGVETKAQRDLLTLFGCDYMQGYLYSRPVPVSEFEKLLAENECLSNPAENWVI